MNIREKLNNKCDFKAVIENVDQTLCSTRMMGMAVSEYKFLQWRTFWEQVHGNLVTHKRWMEMLTVSREMLRAFPTPASLQIFCTMRGERTQEDGRYNLYMEGEEADYWISASTIPGAYTIKVHSIIKEGS